jgi:hypothetical protein
LPPPLQQLVDGAELLLGLLQLHTKTLHAAGMLLDHHLLLGHGVVDLEGELLQVAQLLDGGGLPRGRTEALLVLGEVGLELLALMHRRLPLLFGRRDLAQGFVAQLLGMLLQRHQGFVGLCHSACSWCVQRRNPSGRVPRMCCMKA